MSTGHLGSERLQAYHDGECADAERQDIASHLSACLTCQNQLDDWSRISRHLFAPSSVNAPAFLWTRVLAGIEREEAQREAPWWVEWRWMTRVTVAASLLVGLGSFYIYKQSATPLEVALQGRSTQQQAIQVASAAGASPDDAASLVLEGESWAVN